ncbi:transmembrane protein [Babesia ovis]|uniref:Transmembrane protein n=1 Tax=Babesia ovis TaxID=5869 RepID=A0A9W5WW53_BABOV|nr:transmembrane protein [Babesia ovis]
MYDRRDFVSLYDRLKISTYGFRHGCIQLFTVLLVFSFQQSILYYTIYYLRNEPRLFYLLIFDVIIVLYLLGGATSAKGHSPSRISVQWRLCCTSTAVKLAVLLLMRNNDDVSALPGFNRFASEDYLSFVGFYLTPVIYILFNRISNRFLFNREKRNVNVDELLHSDLALATAVDLWDIVIMVNHLFRRYRSIKDLDNDPTTQAWEDRNFVAYAILCAVSTFLLGFVSPSVDSDLDTGSGVLESRRLFWSNLLDYFRCSGRRIQDDVGFRDEPRSHDRGFDSQGTEAPHVFKAKNGPKGQYLDMFTIAKFTFLIGFSLIDIPFFVYRLVLLLQNNVFSLMIYKNFLGLIIRPYRLTLSQLAERDSAKGWQTAFFDAAPLFKDPSTKKILHDDLKLLDEPTVPETERQLSTKLSDRAMLKRGLTSSYLSQARTLTRPFATRTGSNNAYDNRPSRSTMRFRTSHMMSSDRGTQGVELNALNSSPTDPAVPRLRFNSLHPAASHQDWASCTSESDLPSVAEAIEADEKNERQKLLLIRKLKRHRELPVATLGFKILFRNLTELLQRMFSVDPSFEMDDEEFMVSVRHFDYSRMLCALFLMLISRIIIVICCYANPSEVRSPRFIFGSTAFTATAQELVVYGLVVGAPLVYSMLFYRVQGCSLLDCVAYGLHEVLKLGSYVTCVCCLRGIVSNPGSVLYALQVCVLIQWPLHLTVLILFYASKKSLNMVRLMYVLCKHSCCPVGLNHNLFCLDIMKSTTIADTLLQSQWNCYFYGALFSALCCSFSPTKTEVMIILVDLFIRFVYVIFCQTMRAMMLRKFEIHYLMLRLTNALTFDYLPPSDTFSVSSDSSSHFVTPADVDTYIKEQGLLSSPGILFPPFI